MKLAVIIPDRGDRYKLTENCIDTILRQTLRPIYIHHVDENVIMPSKKIDLTKRYKLAYSEIAKHVDLVAFIENDDWYAPDYLEIMYNLWEKNGRPDLFGTNYTVYYHLKIQKYLTFRHHGRSSAMNTFIVPGLDLNWPADDEPFLDMHLWRTVSNKLAIEPPKIISVGMKGHGEGMSGGLFHNDRLEKYINDDNGFLRNTLDKESYEFYSRYLTNNGNEKETRILQAGEN